MAVAARRHSATYADLDALPEGTNAELIRGEMHVSPRPASRHASVGSVLGGLLIGPFRFGNGGPGGWIILDEPELRISPDCLIPDLAGWRRERMPELPDVAAFDLAPDWVCEILSPSTEARDRSAKLPLYARWGVRHIWLADPGVETLEVLRLGDGGSWTLVSTFAGAAKVRAEPFDAIELDLALLWAR